MLGLTLVRPKRSEQVNLRKRRELSENREATSQSLLCEISHGDIEGQFSVPCERNKFKGML